jgi:hypothetical protein
MVCEVAWTGNHGRAGSLDVVAGVVVNDWSSGGGACGALLRLVW